jgi:hypothetical protein
LLGAAFLDVFSHLLQTATAMQQFPGVRELTQSILQQQLQLRTAMQLSA